MTIYIGADHRGFELKESLKKFLIESGYKTVDLGANAYNKDDDYPDFAKAVAEKVTESPEEIKGIVICRSGVGVSVVANKFKGVRAGLITDIEQARLSRLDDDINVLAISSELTDENKAKEIVRIFLTTEFSGLEKDKRRIGNIERLIG